MDLIYRFRNILLQIVFHFTDIFEHCDTWFQDDTGFVCTDHLEMIGQCVHLLQISAVYSIFLDEQQDIRIYLMYLVDDFLYVVFVVLRIQGRESQCMDKSDRSHRRQKIKNIYFAYKQAAI